MHHRKRHVEAVLLKRAKIFPVLGVLGPRQVGKSTFLMKQWSLQQHAEYFTFDKQAVIGRARRAPEQFLLTETAEQTEPIIIDEAQKVPEIFDSIKALVDEHRRLGLFTLSGSVEFSSKAGVRESLAGRMGITRLYPLTLRELNGQTLSTPWVDFNFEAAASLPVKSIEKWIERGGMPIFCSLEDTDERANMIHSWLEAICYRDIKQLKDGPYDSELAFALLNNIAEEPAFYLHRTALDLGHSRQSIQKHLQALQSLFLIYELPAFDSPRAHSLYRLFDAGVLHTLSGGKSSVSNQHQGLVTLLMNEIYAQYEYAGKLKPQLYYYKTLGGAEIDLVLQTKESLVGIECVMHSDIPPYRQRGMKRFLEKYPNAQGYLVAPVDRAYTLAPRLHVIPWGAVG